MAVTGWKSPSTNGSPDNDWQSPAFPASNLYSSNNVRGAGTDQQAHSFAGFGFSTADVPAGSTITDVEVSLEGRVGTTGQQVQVTAQLVIAGANAGIYPGFTNYTLTSDRTYTVLGYTTLPTAAQVIAADFGITLKAYEITSLATFLGDHVQIRVYYETAITVTLSETVSAADSVSHGLGMTFSEIVTGYDAASSSVYNSGASPGTPPGVEKTIVPVAYTEKFIVRKNCVERSMTTASTTGKTIMSYVTTKKTIISITPSPKTIVSYANTEKVIQ
jgi:hypothetical protein